MSGKEPGWNAEGLLQPLWLKYPGGRDGLAAKVGTTGSALSSRNSGSRPLGYDLGSRLAAELGVSVLELGAPLEVADAAGETLVTRLEGLAVDLAEAVRKQSGMATQIARLQARVRTLEARPWPAEDQSKGQAGGP